MAARECQWLGVAMEMTSMFLSSTTLRMSCSYLGGCALGLLGAGHGVADDGRVGVADGGDDAVVLAGEAVDVAPAAAVDADDGDAQRAVGVAGLGCLCRLGGGGGLADDAGAGQRGQHGRILDEITPIQKTHREHSSPEGGMGGRRNGAMFPLYPPPARVNHFCWFLLWIGGGSPSIIHHLEGDNASGDGQAQRDVDYNVNRNASRIVIAVDAVVVRAALVAADYD